jgi:branched-chain amino acid transport system permease protein
VIQQVLSGLEAGSWYALLAMALVVIMKSTGVANFAIGDIGLLAAFVALTLTNFGMPFPVVVAGGLLCAILLGIGLEFFVMRRVPSRSHFALLLVTIAIALVLDSVIELVWGTNPTVLPAPWTNRQLDFGGEVVPWAQLISIAVGVLAAFGLARFFRTRLGAQMRAVAENPAAAQVLGVSLNRVALISWAMAAALSGAAMILLTQARILTSSSAAAVIVPAFVAAIIGGFSSLTGAFFAGLALGVLQNLAGGFISTGSKEAIALVVVLVVLLVKPRGFGGASTVREV